MHPTTLPTLVATLLLAAAPLAQAVATATANGQSVTDPTFATLASGTVAASADQGDATLQVLSSGQGQGGFTSPRVGAEGRIDARFTVVGLSGPATLAFDWAFTGARTWSTESASFGSGLGAGIFMDTGAIYIHQIGWGISYVDGPVFMGDFAGILEAPVGVVGQAGAPGLFSEVLPGGNWGGQGLTTAQTLWTMDNGWGGTLSLWSGIGVSGEVDASYGVELLGVTIAPALLAQAAPGGAYLLLDNGTQIPITAAVPEPAPAALLACGLLVMGWRLRQQARPQA